MFSISYNQFLTNFGDNKTKYYASLPAVQPDKTKQRVDVTIATSYAYTFEH